MHPLQQGELRSQSYHGRLNTTFRFDFPIGRRFMELPFRVGVRPSIKQARRGSLTNI